MARKNIGANISLVDQFTGTSKKFLTSITGMSSATTNATGNLKKMSKQGASTGSSIMSMAKTVVGAVASFAVIKKGVDFLKSCTEAAQNAEVATRQLETVMKNTGATEAQITAVKNAGSALSSYTTVSGTAAKMGGAQLAVFGLQASSIEKLMPALGDMAVGINGINVSQEQMETTAKMLGKAMTGSTVALRKAGIIIDENGQKILKSGTEAEKLEVITNAVAKSYGGIAKVMAETPEGRIILMQKAWKGVKKEIGDAVLPIYTKILDMIYTKVPMIKDMILSAVRGITPAFAYFSDKVLPFVSSAIEYIGSIATRVFSSVGKAITTVKEKMSQLSIGGNGVGDALTNAFNAAQPIISWIIDVGLPMAVSFIGDVIIKATELYNFFASNWTQIEPWVLGIAGAIATLKFVSFSYAVATRIMEGATKAWTVATNIAKWAQVNLSIAKLSDIKDTIILKALYTKDAIVKGISTAATWGQTAATWAANVATSALTAVQWLLNAAFLASPIGWIVLGIGLIVGAFILLWKKSEGFRNFFINMWERIKTSASAFINWIKPVFQAIGKFFITLWNGIKNVFIAVWNGIKSAVTTIVGGLVTAVKWYFQTWWTVVSTVFTAIWNTAVSIWNGIKNAVTFVVGGIVTAVQWYFNLWWTVVSTVLTTIRDVITTIWHGISSTVIGVVSWISTGISNAWNWILTTTTNVFTTIKDTIVGIFTSIWTGIKTAINWIITGINKFTAGIAKGINGITGVISLIPGVEIGQVTAPQIPLLATGGNITRKGTALVGEAGPELLNLPRGASVTPLEKASNVQNHFEININGSNLGVDEILNILVPKLKLAIANM